MAKTFKNKKSKSWLIANETEENNTLRSILGERELFKINMQALQGEFDKRRKELLDEHIGNCSDMMFYIAECLGMDLDTFDPKDPVWRIDTEYLEEHGHGYLVYDPQMGHARMVNTDVLTFPDDDDTMH